MMRFVSFIIVCLFTLAAVAASNRAQPLVVEAHSPGRWMFNQADYERCVTVETPPLKEPVSIHGVPVVDPSV